MGSRRLVRTTGVFDAWASTAITAPPRTGAVVGLIE